MFTIWVIFHVIVCIALVLVVLMQSAKGGGLSGSVFGGGGGGMGGAVFGGRGAASFLSKATTVLAVLFMLNCGALAYMSARPTTAGPAIDMGTTDSPVTRQAQEERQRFLEQQQRQQIDQSPDAQTTTPVQISPGEAADTDDSGN